MNNPMSILSNYMGMINRTPVLKNALTLFQKGDSKGLEELARNVMKSQGKDFDSEFNNFMKSMHG